MSRDPLNFDVLASSSAGCCYRLSGGGTTAPLLIEAGIRFPLIRQGLNFKVSELAGCLVTHSHGDHSCGMAELAKYGVDIYASAETFAAKPVVGHRQNVIYPGEEFMVDKWQVLPFRTVHDCDGSLGFVIGSPSGERLLFLTDSAYVEHTFAGLTMIAVEANWSGEIIKGNVLGDRIDVGRMKRTVCTHMSLEQLIKLLKANDLSKVEGITLLHLSDDNSDEEEFRRRVERETGIPTTVAPANGLAVMA